MRTNQINLHKKYQSSIVNSEKLTFLYVYTCMPFVAWRTDWQTYGQNFYIIDAHLSDKSSQKVSVLYCKQYSRNWRFYLYIHSGPLYPDGQINHRIDAHRSDKSSQKKESDLYLKEQPRNSRFSHFFSYGHWDRQKEIYNYRVS